MGDKWTLLIVRDLVAGPRRFVELQRVLPGISTEQLRSRLNRMVADGLLTRQRYREVPPRVDYELTERSRELVPVIAELTRWGHAWAWSPPRESEAIDVAAIFRASTGLLGGAPSGTVELRVEGRGYTLGLGGETATLAEEAPGEADARISGGEQAWIAALGPDADRSGLETSGATQLVDAVLDALGPTASRATVRAA
ncbi:MAG TPA: helix-turn-helix domain-containing protein [Capillimicrobium sp.]|nr:helix-turn-helix domain-containing protein [Capillimicrobium sp.]